MEMGRVFRAEKVSSAGSWDDNPEWLRDAANICLAALRGLEASDKVDFGESCKGAKDLGVRGNCSPLLCPGS